MKLLILAAVLVTALVAVKTDALLTCLGKRGIKTAKECKMCGVIHYKPNKGSDFHFCAKGKTCTDNDEVEKQKKKPEVDKITCCCDRDNCNSSADVMKPCDKTGKGKSNKGPAKNNGKKKGKSKAGNVPTAAFLLTALGALFPLSLAPFPLS